MQHCHTLGELVAMTPCSKQLAIFVTDRKEVNCNEVVRILFSYTSLFIRQRGRCSSLFKGLRQL